MNNIFSYVMDKTLLKASLEVKPGQYLINIRGYICAEHKHNGSGYELGCIVAHPIYMRKFKMENGVKVYLSDKLDYGIFCDFLSVTKTTCTE